MAYQVNFLTSAAPVEAIYKTTAKRLNQRLNEQLNVALNKDIGVVVREYADKSDFDGIRFVLSGQPEVTGAIDDDKSAPLIAFFKDKTSISDKFQAAANEFEQRVNQGLRAAADREIGYMICDCADKRDFDGIRYLLSKHPELINARDSENDTPLIIAVNQGSEKITEFLLTQPGVDINAVGLEEMTAIMWACEHNYTDLGRALLQYPTLNVTAKDEDGDTALILAVQSENAELVRLLLEREGVDVEDKDNNNGSARTISEAFAGNTPDQQEIVQLIKAHKSHKDSIAASLKKTSPKPAEKADAGKAVRPKNAASASTAIRSPALRNLAEVHPYPHSIAFLQWADENNQGSKLRGKSKYKAFISNPDALYGGIKDRMTYDQQALLICKEFGYDPSADYPLLSTGAGPHQKPNAATPD